MSETGAGLQPQGPSGGHGPKSGDKGATAALELLENPTQFLSSVQIGITSIGVLNGIVGEAAFSAAGALAARPGPGRSRRRHRGHRLVVVTLITFITIIFGELVPKRIGQLYPERRASGGRPMLAVHRHAAVRVCCCR
jgi:putative hemolysin